MHADLQQVFDSVPTSGEPSDHSQADKVRWVDVRDSRPLGVGLWPAMDLTNGTITEHDDVTAVLTPLHHDIFVTARVLVEGCVSTHWRAEGSRARRRPVGLLRFLGRIGDSSQ